MSIKSNIATKQRYNAQAGNVKYLNVLDNWDENQFFYGRKNRAGRIIAPFDIATMTQINDTNICFNFVADAFNELSEHYREKVLLGLEPYAGMQTLTPARAYIKPLSLYYEHIKRLETLFLENYLLPEQSEISNFDDVIYQFDRFLGDFGHRYPILYSSFVGSSLCPMQGTALVIDLKGVGHNSDSERDALINDPSFLFMSRLANEYGFVIPKHAPWCLVANLDSRVMVNYAIQYDVLDKNNLVEDYFYECKDHDIDLLKALIFNSYEALFEQFPEKSKTKICKSNRLRTFTTDRLREDSSILSRRYSSKFWFRKYIEILIKERDIKMSKTKLDKLFNECYYMLEKYSFERAYTFVEMKILQTRKDRMR